MASLTERLRVRKIIAERVRRARIATDKDIDDVARAADVNRRKWLRWENARQPIPSDSLPIVARAVNTTTLELLGKLAA